MENNRIYRLARNMNGGSRPLSKTIKNIGLFPENSDIDVFLNPVYGFIWTNFRLVDGYRQFNGYHDKKDLVFKITNDAYHVINGKVQATKNILKFVSSHEMGIFLGNLYYYKTVLINRYQELYTKIKEISMFITRATNVKVLGVEKAAKDLGIITKLIDEKFKSIRVEYIGINELIDNISSDNVDYQNVIKALKNIKKAYNDYIKKTSGDMFTKDGRDIKYIKKIFKPIFRFLDPDAMDLSTDVFHSILGLVWWVADSKEGIVDYYKGINDSMLVKSGSYETIAIPDMFSKIMFTGVIDYENMDFYSGAQYLYAKYIGNIDMYDQDTTYMTLDSGEKIDFPDCVESVLRTFIKLLIYDEGSYDIDILRKLTSDEQLIEFFTVFNDEESQTSRVPRDIFDQKLIARDAWGHLVSNIRDVPYYNKVDDFRYEIKPEAMDNPHANPVVVYDDYDYSDDDDSDYGDDDPATIPSVSYVIEYMLDEIEEFEDIMDRVPELEDLENNLDNKTGRGTITFTIFGANYTIYVDSGHAEITRETNDDEEDYIEEYDDYTGETIMIPPHTFKRTLSKIQYYYIDLIDQDNHIGSYELDTLRKQNRNWFVGLLYSPVHLNRLLVGKYPICFLFNKYEYASIFRYICEKMPDEDLELSNVPMDLYKLYDSGILYEPWLTKFLHAHGMKESIDNLFENGTDIIINNNETTDVFLKKFTNLRNITITALYPDFQVLNGSKNLEQLVIRNVKTPINDGFKDLISLKKLVLDNYAEAISEDSMDNIKSLETLTVRGKYDVSIYKAISKLISLKNLSFYNYNYLNPFDGGKSILYIDEFTKSGYESALSHIRPDTLIIGVNIGNFDFLDNMPTIRRIAFVSRYNKNMKVILDKLPFVSEIVFGYSFDEPINDAFDNLKHLRKLTIRSNIYKYKVKLPIVKFPELKEIVFPIGEFPNIHGRGKRKFISYGLRSHFQKYDMGGVDTDEEEINNKIKEMIGAGYSNSGIVGLVTKLFS